VKEKTVQQQAQSIACAKGVVVCLGQQKKRVVWWSDHLPAIPMVACIYLL